MHTEYDKLQPDHIDALVAPVALYPDRLLATILIAATYPLEVDQASQWLRKDQGVTGAAFDRAAQAQRWDESIKKLIRLRYVLYMMDDRITWAQSVGDALLARKRDVLASIQRLRARAQEAGTLRSTPQQRVIGNENGIVVEPVEPQVANVPQYDPRVAFSDWPHAPPTHTQAVPLRGYISDSIVGFLPGVAVPSNFWSNTIDWKSGEILVTHKATLVNVDGMGASPWTHDPVHRRFVSYSTPELRRRYGRSFVSGQQARWAFRGYESDQPRAANVGFGARKRWNQFRGESYDAQPKQKFSVFEKLGKGSQIRAFSSRGNASITTARRDNAISASRDRQAIGSAAEARPLTGVSAP